MDRRISDESKIDETEALQVPLTRETMGAKIKTPRKVDAMIDQMESMPSPSRDELALRRLKKRRLALRDRMVRLQQWLDPLEPA